MHFSLTDLWLAMGPIAKAVMLLLVGMSIASLTVAIERSRKLARSARTSAAFLGAWRDAVAERGVAAAAAEAERFPGSYTAHLVGEASRVLREPDVGDWLEAHDRTVRRIVIAAGVDAKRGLAVIATVGSTAPFVGLFGTVAGIVTAFHTIGATGQGGIGAVSTGIAEALVATALGILVAIPALWLFNYLTQAAQRLVAELECAGEELAVAALAERGGRGASRSAERRGA